MNAIVGVGILVVAVAADWRTWRLVDRSFTGAFLRCLSGFATALLAFQATASVVNAFVNWWGANCYAGFYQVEAYALAMKLFFLTLGLWLCPARTGVLPPPPSS